VTVSLTVSLTFSAEVSAEFLAEFLAEVSAEVSVIAAISVSSLVLSATCRGAQAEIKVPNPVMMGGQPKTFCSTTAANQHTPPNTNITRTKTRVSLFTCAYTQQTLKKHYPQSGRP
jgi:hypothetical protein